MTKVALIKTKCYDKNEVLNNIIKLFEYFGGINLFFSKNDKVLLKPNLLFARKASEHVTTHPLIIYSLCQLLSDLGCKLIIGDSPGFGNAIYVMKKNGTYDLIKKFNPQFINFEKSVLIEINNPNRIFKSFEVAKEVLEVNKIINIAKLKSHAQMILTLCVKNTFGLIVGLKKPEWHFKAGTNNYIFARMLLELHLAIAPTFNILDGIYGMDGNGPANGTPRKFEILAGGPNAIAIDTTIAYILGLYFKFYTQKVAYDMKLEGAKIEDIEFLGNTPYDFSIKNFKLAKSMEIGWNIPNFLRNYFKNIMLSKPKYDINKCKLCGICQKVCPVLAIKMNEKIEFDLNKCIRCFCCQELCPYGAISVEKSLIEKIKTYRFF